MSMSWDWDLVWQAARSDTSTSIVAVMVLAAFASGSKSSQEKWLKELLEENEARLRNELRSLSDNSTQDLRRTVRELEARVIELTEDSKTYANNLKGMKNTYMKLVMDLEEDIRELKESQAKAIKELKKSHAGEIERLKETHSKSIRELNEGHAKDIKVLNTRLEDNCRSRRDSVRSMFREDLAKEREERMSADAQLSTRLADLCKDMAARRENDDDRVQRLKALIVESEERWEDTSDELYATTRLLSNRITDVQDTVDTQVPRL
ncbi:hypothetical protein CC1G_08486 [Coprinopsis cinerea okayama7|uniref:Uncharacterized protein n=1 Tax=Coprinopsis cinerea (strain Okayama-7 / 130 / ATCC MYA-4618 / FGSC 9003) TaxID=240176 RepID=A8NM42_COPC7|nr:hypothetical protein CC1G_08486 [Coprinopsis cinerea okayama7\|eukprot:XP_001834841.1 hypothetical protein CC1G_08486 [Coprinopsis cinerea okayama7\